MSFLASAIVFSFLIFRASLSIPCPTDQTLSKFHMEGFEGENVQLSYPYKKGSILAIKNGEFVEAVSSSSEKPFKDLYYPCLSPIAYGDVSYFPFRQISEPNDLFPLCEFPKEASVDAKLKDDSEIKQIKIDHQDYLVISLNKLSSAMIFQTLKSRKARMNSPYDFVVKVQSTCLIVDNSVEVAKDLFKHEGVFVVPRGNLQLAYPQSYKTISERQTIFGLFKSIMRQVKSAWSLGFFLNYSKERCLFDFENEKVYCFDISPRLETYSPKDHFGDIYFASMNLVSDKPESMNQRMNVLISNILNSDFSKNLDFEVDFSSLTNENSSEEILEKVLEMLEKLLIMSTYNNSKAVRYLQAIITKLERVPLIRLDDVEAVGVFMGLLEKRRRKPKKSQGEISKIIDEIEEEASLDRAKNHKAIVKNILIFASVVLGLLIFAGVFVVAL